MRVTARTHSNTVVVLPPPKLLPDIGLGCPYYLLEVGNDPRADVLIPKRLADVELPCALLVVIAPDRPAMGADCHRIARVINRVAEAEGYPFRAFRKAGPAGPDNQIHLRLYGISDMI